MRDGIARAGDGIWRVRVVVRDERTGKRVNRKATVRGSRSDAVKVRAELAAGPRLARIRLRDYAAAWLAARAALVKPSVSRRYALALRHAMGELGDLYLDAVTPADVRAYVAGRTSSGAAGGTVLNELRVLRTIARDAAADGHGNGRWCERVPRPVVNRWTEDRPNLLTPEEFARVLERVGARWRPLVLLLATTGLRWGEATGLRWRDIRDGWAVIERANWKGTDVSVKTRSSARRVPIPSQALSALGDRGPDDQLVFRTARGTAHRGSPLRTVLERACAAAGVRRITTHGLRRTWNDVARRVAEGQVVRAIMGHASDAMTAHYSMVGADERREVSRRVSRLLAPPVGPSKTPGAEGCLQTVALPLGDGTLSENSTSYREPDDWEDRLW